MLRKESNPKNDVTNDVNSPRLNSIDKIDEEKAESFDMASIPSAVMKKTMLFLAKQHTDTSHESASMHTTTASSMSLVDSVSKVVEVGKEEKDTCSSASFVSFIFVPSVLNDFFRLLIFAFLCIHYKKVIFLMIQSNGL